MSEFMTVTEVAEYLRLRPATIYGMVYSRRIPFRKHGSRVVFDRDEVDRWSKSKEVRPLEDATPIVPTGHGMTPLRQTRGSLKTLRKSKRQPPKKEVD